MTRTWTSHRNQQTTYEPKKFIIFESFLPSSLACMKLTSLPCIHGCSKERWIFSPRIVNLQLCSSFRSLVSETFFQLNKSQLDTADSPIHTLCYTTLLMYSSGNLNPQIFWNSLFFFHECQILVWVKCTVLLECSWSQIEIFSEVRL